jgi:hypothetical protein
MDGQHSSRHRDSKARGTSFYGGPKGKQLFCRTRGIVAALFQSCASRRDRRALQSRLAAYQKLFERIFRSSPFEFGRLKQWLMVCGWARLCHEHVAGSGALFRSQMAREKGRRVGNRRSRLTKEEAQLPRRRIAIESSKALRPRAECLWVVGIPIGSGRGRADAASPSFGLSSLSNGSA